MPAIETADRHQTAMLWPASGQGDYGKHKVTAPIQIKVRWEDRQSETVDSQGNTIGTNATVVVDRVIAVGSIMWLGKKDDLADPPVNLKEVVDYSAIPDVKGRKTRRVVKLVRHSNKLPAITS